MDLIRNTYKPTWTSFATVLIVGYGNPSFLAAFCPHVLVAQLSLMRS